MNSILRRALSWFRPLPQSKLDLDPVLHPPKPGPRGKCAVLVPVSHHIEPATDEALRELERMGYVVWRRWGYSAIDQGRCLMAQEALDAGFDELLWVDADVAFWPGDVDRVRGLGLSVVAGAYPVKGWPVMTFEPMEMLPIHFGQNAPLVPLRYAATGFLYTHARVYRAIRALEGGSAVLIWGQKRAYPWFYPLLHEGQYLGEDFAFCHRVRQAGYNIVLDPSVRLAHIGRHSYSWGFVANGVPKPEPDCLTYQPPEVTRETAGS